MQLEHTRYADALVAAPVGRLNHDNAEALRAALEPLLAGCAAGRDTLVLDFSRLDYISSAGLRVLMLAAKQARAQGGRIVVAALQPVVREIFEISRFNMVLETQESVDAALASVSSAALAARHGS